VVVLRLVDYFIRFLLAFAEKKFLINFSSFYIDMVFSGKKKIIVKILLCFFFLKELIGWPAICALEKLFRQFSTAYTLSKIMTQIVVFNLVLYLL
jgi:hypothetical protein